MKFPRHVLALAALASLPLSAFAAQPSPASVEERVDNLLAQMTLEEKSALVHGDTQFSSPGVPRLGVPRFWMSDGPHGVREEISLDSWKPAGRTDDFSTYMPIFVALAATWDPVSAHDYGATIAEEALKRGKHMMLGPGVNIVRTPLNGRNFEYLGEDPLLAGQLAVADIRGMQEKQVSACVKHYALNNQEDHRGTINVDVDERTLREIYLPAFEASVKEGKVWSVMGAYNKYQNVHACHNDILLNQILKKEWGFDGLVVSDWGGVHDTVEAANGGMDLEMGSGRNWDAFHFGRPLREAIQAGKVPLAALDDKVRRILRVSLRTGSLDGRDEGSINTPAHQAAALRIAEKSLVLLQNREGLLPLDLSKVRSIAVIGENATRKHAHGGQSSELKAFYEVTPLEGILRLVKPGTNVNYSAGYASPVYRRNGTTGLGGVQAEVLDTSANPPAEELQAQAEKLARESEVAILFVGLNHDRHFDTEGSDRLSLALPGEQAALIQRVVAANPRTIVVMMSGSPVEMDAWIGKVPSVLQAWFPGMEGGNAIARALFGKVNPSGKLPVSFPHRLQDSPAHATGDARQYPGLDGTVHYDEGMLVGYRWYDTKGIEPLFPFGHGLSYSRFDYSAPAISGGPTAAKASLTLKNSSAVDGEEVVQVYVAAKDSPVSHPSQELRGFLRVALKAGESRQVEIPLSPRAFAYWSVEKKAWLIPVASYEVRLSASSRDPRLTLPYQVTTAATVD